MKKLVSILLICVMLLSVVPTMTMAAPNPGFQDFPFKDVEILHNSGYFNIKSLYDQGIISGKTETEFAPLDPITREEVAKVITKAAKMNLTDKTGTFSDVESGSWYEQYVETVSESGIMLGVGNGQFGVGNNITRQDAIIMLVRFADYMGIQLEIIEQFAINDMDEAAEYAKEAINTLVQMNVVPLDNNKVNPEDNITRLDFCTYLDRILISDVRAYDDVLQDWIPVEKPVDEYDSETLAFEDFENGITTLGEWEPGYGVPYASERIVKGEGKESDHSLHLTTTSDYSAVDLYYYDPDPSTDYYVSWDIKTKGLGTCFVRVNLVWATPTGNIGGGYNVNADVKGDNDWLSFSHSSTSPTPDLGCKYLRIVFSIRGSTDGEAWIDNVKIRKIIYEPVTTYLKKPAYKGLIYDPNGESDINLTSYIKGVGSTYPAETTKLVASISDLEGNVLMESEHLSPTSEMDVTFSSKSLAVGDYDLEAKLVDTVTGKVHGSNHYMIRKREPDYRPAMYFDEEGRLIKDGKPWFAHGVYALGTYESVYNDLVGTPFEVILSNSTGSFFPYYDEFTEAGEKGIGAIYDSAYIFKSSLRRQYQQRDVTTIASERPILERVVKELDFPNNPGFLAYGLNNESNPLMWGNRMGWHNQLLAEMDLDHFTYGVSMGGPGVAAANSRMQDVYACDEPYPITGAITDEIWGVWEKQKPVVEELVNRPEWAVLQISDLKLMGREPYLSRERGPNETELRNMAWQAIAAGTQGILWYAHFHMARKEAGRPYSETFQELLRVTEELKMFEDAFLSREDAPDLYQKADIPDRFAYGARRYDGKTYVFLVNMDKNTQTVSVKLEDAKSIHGAYSDKEYTAGDDNYVDVTLEGLGVEVLIVDQPDPKSPDCKLKNIHFSNGEKNYFVSVVEDDADVITVADCATQINYNVSMHKDATLKLDGEVVSSKGTASIEGKDSITFTIVSEDGAHSCDYVYNIIRKAKTE